MKSDDYLEMHLVIIISMKVNVDNIPTLMHLFQFADSALPVGSFSFSNGLESAASLSLVQNADSLCEFVNAQARLCAFSDAVAAIYAFRASIKSDYNAIAEADEFLYQSKMNKETRQMSRKMGRKYAELCTDFIDSPLLCRWLCDIKEEKLPGCYSIGQGLVFAIIGANEYELFATILYGFVSMTLSAGLRLIKVSHHDTQKILFRFAECVEDMYNQVSKMKLEDINSFFPQLDFIASVHEKGKTRMFMN